MQQNNETNMQSVRPSEELSEAWQELLGASGQEAYRSGKTTEQIQIPTIASDPWRELLQDKSNELVDLQQLNLRMSDQDVEQVLQIMQEHPGDTRRA